MSSGLAAMRDLPTVFLATPAAHNQLTTIYTHSLLHTAGAFAAETIRWTAVFEPKGWCAMARNLLVAKFLALEEFTDLVFLDADLRWNPKDVLRLLASEHDVVGAYYPSRNADWANASGQMHETPEAAQRAVMRGTYPHLEMTKREPGLTEVQVDFLPTGFLRIKRDVFRRFRAHHGESRAYTYDGNDVYGYFTHPIEGGKYWGEDVAFCKHWYEAGGTCWKLLGADLGHFGEMLF